MSAWANTACPFRRARRSSIRRPAGPSARDVRRVWFLRMEPELEARARRNLQRVRKLVQLYRDLAGPGRGRRPVETIDLLRSAVVFLHATLEDALRTLLVERWVLATDTSHFADLPI